MKQLIRKLLGIKGIEAWAIIDDAGFLLVQNRPEMDCQMYVDSRGLVARRENLKIIPCTIIY